MNNYVEYEIHIIPVESPKDKNKKLYSAVYHCGEDKNCAINQFDEKVEEIGRGSDIKVPCNVLLLEKTVNYTTLSTAEIY